MISTPSTLFREVHGALVAKLICITFSVNLGDAAAYVNGFPHAAWRIIAQYYISWFKKGVAPTVTVSLPASNRNIIYLLTCDG